MIKISKINKYYNKGKRDEIHVINNVSLEFKETGLVCVLGESGSGKTTLVNTIGGLDYYEEGTIEVNGENIKNSKSKKYEKIRNENYGYVFQNYYLLEEQTVYDNIKLCLNMFEISDEEKEERINIVLKSVGMENYKKRVVRNLSGGQQQRISIARALVKSPNVIFADEPTGNLDEENTLNVMGILKKVSKNCLVIVVTHERNIANFFADRIINVSDGKIVSDEIVNDNGKYEYTDNNNLYLKEYNKIEENGAYIDYNYYTKKSCDKDTNSKLKLKIIYEFGRYYIKSEQKEDIIVLSNNNKMKVVDTYKPKIDITKVEDNVDFKIDKIKQVKSPNLSMWQIMILALRNIQMFGKKQLFLVISLLVMSVLVTITVKDFSEISSIDKNSIVKNDSHYLTVEVKKDEDITNTELEKYVGKIFDEFNKPELDGYIYINNKKSFNYEYKGFFEIRKLKSKLTDFDFVPLKYLDKDNLLYGRMPKYSNEIVIDLQVVERFIKKNPMLNLLFKSPKFILNKEFYISRKKFPYVVVGVSKTNEATIYIDKFDGIGVLPWFYQCTSIDKIKNMFPEEYSNLTLSEYEVLLKEKISISSEEIKLFDKKYKIKNFLINGANTELVISDDAYTRLLKQTCSFNKTFNIYTNDKNKILEYAREISRKTIYKDISIVVSDKYKQQLALYEKQRKIKINSKVIIIFSIVLICLVVLYYTMKSNALRNIKNISVYRLLGIKKSSIAMLYIVENIIISSYTTLIGVLLTSCVYKFLANIPSLELKDVLPWYIIIATVLSLYVLNILIGLLPIRSILKLMPAQITAKYNL